MAEATIDRLQIQIEAEAAEGSKGLDKFISSMERLKNMVAGGMPGLSDIVTKFRDLSESVNGLKGKSATINSIAKSFEKLNNLDVSRAAKQLSDVGKSMQGLGSLSADVKQFADSLNSVSGVDLQSGKMQAQIMKQQAAIAKAQAIIDQSALKSAKAAMGLDAIAEKNRKIEESAKFAAEAQENLDNIVQRAAKRNGYTPTGVESFPSEAGGKKYKMASHVFDTDGLQRASETVDSAVGKTAKKMNLLQRLSAQYYAKLDFIKSILSKIGVYGKENLGQIETATKKVTSETGRAAKSFRSLLKETKVKSGSGGISELLKLSNFIKGTFLIGIISEVRKAVRAVENFITEGIRNAINAPEIENLFRVALGGMANEAAEFAEQFRKALGVDIYATKEMLGTFQSLETAMGIGERTAYKMSKSLTILANDMASLYNVKPEQAFENLQSALTGQGRAVRKYGYVITEATIKQTAWKYGVVAVGQELNEQQKVLARYLALIDQSSNAQGDMARTIGSVQNQLRLLGQNVTSAGRAIGESFIPFIEAVTPLLNAFFVVLQRLGTSLARFTYSLFGKDYDAEKKKQQETITGIGGIGSSLDNTADSAKDAGKQMKNLISGFDELNILQKKVDSATAPELGGGGLDFDVPELNIPNIESPYEKMADDFFNKINSMFQSIKDFWDKYFAKPFADAWAKIKPQLEALKETFKGIFEDIKTLAEPLESWFFEHVIPMLQQLIETGGEVIAGLLEVANTVISDVWEALFPMIESFVVYALPVITDFVTEAIKTFGTLFNEVKTIFLMIWDAAIKPVIDLISLVWQDMMKKVSDTWAKWGEPLFQKIRDTITNMSQFLQNHWNTIIRPILDQVFEVLRNLWEQHMSPLIDKIWNFTLKLIDSALEIYNKFILPIVNWFVNVLGPPIVEIVNLIIRVIGDALGTIMDVAGGIIDALSGVLDFVTGVLTGDWEKAWTGIKEIAIGVWDAFTAQFSGGIKIVQEILSTFASWISSAWSALWNGISSLFTSIWTGMKSTGKMLVDSIKQIITGFIDSVKILWSSGWDAIKNTFSNIWDGMKNVASRAIDSIKGFVAGLIDKVRDAINWVKDLIGLNKEADRTTKNSRSSGSSRGIDTYSMERSVAPFREQAASFRALSLAQTTTPAAETFSAAPATFSAEPAVYADGAYSENGIVSGYQKAQNNSPSKNVNAKDAVIAANAELANAMYQMAIMIVEAIENNGVEISADSKGIFKAVKKEAGNYKRVTGSPAF